MSKRSDLEQQVADLQARLEKAERDVAEVSGANGRLAEKAGRTEEAEAALARTHENRVEAWRQVGVLKQQLADRDITLRGLAEERDAAVAAVEVMRLADLETGMAS